MTDEMRSKQIDTILTVLGAYPQDLVKAALKRRNAHLRGERLAAGWRLYPGNGEPDPSQYSAFDKMRLGDRWYVRERPAAPERPMPAAAAGQGKSLRKSAPVPAQSANGGQKTDLSMKPTDRKCPTCGEVMAWEPICPGCALGRMGFSGRYVCMDDFGHTFYVTKPGVELPNQ